MILFKMHTFALFLLLLFRFAESQVNFDQIESCNKAQYYDTKHLRCKSCPDNSSQKEKDVFNCKCDTKYYFTKNNGGSQIQCEKCPDNFTQSLDGFECVQNTINTDCNADSINSNQSCKSCKSLLFTNSNKNITSSKCSFTNDQFKGGLIFLDTNYSDDPNTFDAIFNGEKIKSWYYEEYFVSTYRLDKFNASSSQVLYNLCVMQINRELNPCLNKIKNMSGYSFQSILPIKVQYNQNYQVGDNLKYLAAEFSFDGTLKTFGQFEMSKLQLCNAVSPYQTILDNNWLFSLKNIEQKCSISVKKLLEKETIFYDLYLQYQTVNMTNTIQISSKKSIYHRFFLIDTISAKIDSNSKPKYIRFAKSVVLTYNLVKNNNDGQIEIPELNIEYDSISTDNENATVDIEFTIEYKTDIENQLKIVYISLGIVCVFALVFSVIKCASWNKRAGKHAIDLITIFKFVMIILNYLANSFYIIIVCTCIYWLIFYRAQKVAYLLLPSESDEKIFIIFLIIPTILKTISVFYTILVQTSYDIIFIDWEKSKNSDTSYKNEIETNNKHDLKNLNKVSCWRMLFVANEWNEIQVFRKINPTFQIILVLFFLKVINLENLAVRGVEYDLNSNQTGSFSIVLRIGIGSAMFLAIGAFQLCFYVLFYSRLIEDRIGKFIDFCSISNISMLIMTHCQYGYYIHGRSPHGFADTSMYQIIQSLSREQFNLVAKRGLEVDSDHQTFSFLITCKLSRFISKITAPLNESRQTYQHAKAEDLERRMISYAKLNSFLSGFIDKILREVPYEITRRNVVENFLNIELKNTNVSSWFYKDPEDCFTDTIFFGIEKDLFVFDMLIFLFVDYLSKNFVLSAVVLFIINRLLNKIRSDLGKRTISKKTSIDKRFLLKYFSLIFQ